MYYGGLNTVQTYVPWNVHEPSPGKFVWTGYSNGFADVITFLKLAQKNNLLVILRLGPYVCGEWEYGGLPPWLLQLYPNYAPRTSDANYLKRIDIFWDQLLPLLKPYLYSNGGPVIFAQIENEYGSYGSDKVYLTHLRDSIIHAFGNGSVIIYSTDPVNPSSLQKTYIPGVYQTVDFSSGHDIPSSFVTQHMYDQNTPDMNSEYYTGWYINWLGVKTELKDPPKNFDDGLTQILTLGASVNFYMYHGGTNFGFMNGASGDESTYSSVITSYDYTAPLSEAGDPSVEYTNIRNIISKFAPVPSGNPPTPAPKGNYGRVQITHQITILDAIHTTSFATVTPVSTEPQTFEQLGLSYGFILYRANVSRISTSSAALVLNVHDRASIIADVNYVGLIQRGSNTTITIPKTSQLDILVENQGRISHGKYMRDWKGLQTATLGGQQVTSWQAYLLPFENLSGLPFATLSSTKLPAVYQASFTISGSPLDTFLNMAGWNKGIVLINGFNIGRYWQLGPQKTLYVPASILKSGANLLQVFETESVSTPSVLFQTTPIL